ncbi:MAG: ornithine cyclodeaminase family protein, partial [Chloroflexota bacterium]
PHHLAHPEHAVTLYLTEQQVGDLLSMDMALDAVEEVFRARSLGEVVNHPRQRIGLGTGVYNLMAAGWPARGIVGSKSYVGGSGSITFQVLLYSSSGEGLLAVMDANLLGQIRTGAASGVGTKHLARRGASNVAIIGAGYQARTQLEAISKVTGVEHARVFSRTPERRESFASEMSEKMGFEITPTASPQECVEGADVVVTITSARDPVLHGEWLKPGMHINAAGANGWMRRELDSDAVTRCDLITTDDIDQAKIECADIMAPAATGRVLWERVLHLGDVVSGKHPGRTSDSQITLFESQGVAMEDIAVAHRVYQKAREQGVGTELPG